jgi:hypothetical protein
MGIIRERVLLEAVFIRVISVIRIIRDGYYS